MVTPASAGGTPRELAPFIKRADEIQAHNSLMAYYCECAPARSHASSSSTCPLN